MITNRQTSLLAILVLSFQVAFSLTVTNDKYSRFVNFSVSSGLSHHQVNDILQDFKGFMWFATENGLSRFDGYSFTSYYYDAESINSLPGNTVTSLAIDSNNQLWVGTTEGLCKINTNTGKIVRVMAEGGNSDAPRTNHIRKLFYSLSTSILWVETLEGTLSSININTGKWEHFLHTPINQPYYRYHVIYEDSKKNIWVGGRNTPILKFNPTRKSFHTISAMGLDVDGKRDNDFASIIETSKGEWYVVGLDGIYQFYPETEKFTKIYGSSTYSIVEDDEGYLWFGSGNGLLRFHSPSKSLHKFVNNQNNSNTIVHNHINKVFIDLMGNIWVGTRNGVSLLSQKTRLFEHFYHIPGDKSSLSSNEVTSFAQSADGTLYIGTANNGLNIKNPNKQEFIQKIFNSNNSCSISSDRISTLYIDSQETLWVGLWSGLGFNKYDDKTDCFTRYAIDSESRKSDWYNAFLETSNNEFILGVWGANGATYFDRKKGVVLNRNFITFENSLDRNVRLIAEDGYGQYFFVANFQGVLFQYNSTKKKFSSHTYPTNKFSAYDDYKGIYFDIPFPFTDCNAIATNGNGITLFATDKGIIAYSDSQGFYSFHKATINPASLAIVNDTIYLLEPNKLSVFNLNGEKQAEIETDSQLPKNITVLDDGGIIFFDGMDLLYGKKENISTIGFKRISIPETNSVADAIADNESIWIGSSNGLFRLNKQALTKDITIPNPKPLLDFPITALQKVDDNSIVAFSAHGIFRVDINSGETESIKLKDISAGFNTAVSAVSKVSADTLWVGNETGHYQIVLSTGELIATNLPGEYRVSSHLTSTLMQDRKGNIWVGTTDKGLNRIDATTKRVRHFFASKSESTLPSNCINSTLQSTDGRIWVATDKGLCYIDDDHVFRVNDPLAQLDARSITEDLNGILWVGTSRGLISINPSTAQITFYDEANGLPSANFSRASKLLANGDLAFGTSTGYFVFDPAGFNEEVDYSNNVHFSKFSIFDKTFRNHFKTNDTLNLHYSQNFFQIHFSATDFGLKSGTIFRYKLNGVDPTWVQSQNQSVSYTNISPGSYLFEVTKLLPNGLPSANSSTLLILIKPPIWKTIWFRMAIILIITMGLLAYVLVYIRQLKVARRNVELEQRLLSSQMNPHFIFNSLSAIQSFMYSNNPEEAGNYLSSFSRLIRLILENSRSETISVKQELQTLELYLSLQKLRFPNKFNYQIDIDNNLLDSELKIPPMLAQPFIENSIEHGIMHKQGIGNIVITLKKSDNKLYISVEDDGIGIKESKVINKDIRMSHNSLAISITRERIKHFSSWREKKAGIKIFDLTTEGSEGTRVEIVFPIKS